MNRTTKRRRRKRQRVIRFPFRRDAFARRRNSLESSRKTFHARIIFSSLPSFSLSLSLIFAKRDSDVNAPHFQTFNETRNREMFAEEGVEGGEGAVGKRDVPRVSPPSLPIVAGGSEVTQRGTRRIVDKTDDTRPVIINTPCVFSSFFFLSRKRVFVAVRRGERRGEERKERAMEPSLLHCKHRIFFFFFLFVCFSYFDRIGRRAVGKASDTSHYLASPLSVFRSTSTDLSRVNIFR